MTVHADHSIKNIQKVLLVSILFLLFVGVFTSGNQQLTHLLGGVIGLLGVSSLSLFFIVCKDELHPVEVLATIGLGLFCVSMCVAGLGEIF